MDAVEAVTEAKRSAGQDGPGRGCHRAAGLEPATVVEADEHVFALDAPALGECPFKSAADCPRGDGYHAVPIADLRAPQHVKDRLSANDGTGIKGVATQTHVAGFAFKAEHEGAS